MTKHKDPLAKYRRKDAPLMWGAGAWYEREKDDHATYTFKSRFGDDVPLYNVDLKTPNELLELPRKLAPDIFVIPADMNFECAGDDVWFPKAPSPRPYQEPLISETFDFLNEGKSGVVCAHTGWGKTVLGFAAASFVCKKTLVVTTKEDIYQQWLQGAHDFLGLKPEEIGEIRGDLCEVLPPAKFCVALVQSLSKADKYPVGTFDSFGLLIVDECHRMAADQFQKIMWLIPAKLRLGLTATLARQDGKELLLYAHIGPMRAEAKSEGLVPKVLMFTSQWNCPRKAVPVLHEGEIKMQFHTIPHEPGKTTHIEKIIAKDKQRNVRIAELIHSAWAKGRRIVVFSTLYEHLDLIYMECTKLGIHLHAMGHYRSASTKADEVRNEHAMGAQVVFTSYAMMGEGTDWPWLDTCILAMPKAKVTQPVGRIRREYDDKKDLVVIDIWDKDSPVFEGYGWSRRKWYASIGAEIVDYDL